MGLTKRFQEIEQFTRSKDYHLLPIRFTELDDTRTVLTNMAGEYLVVDTGIVSDLINKNSELQSEILDDLYSKHMIYDGESRTPLKLLALKYRTKITRLKDFTSLHIIVTTLRCDYTCHYCQVSRQNISSAESEFDMSFETANKAIELIFQSPSKQLKIEFQGGEPLLNIEVIYHVVKKSALIAKSQDRDIQFVIATNLSMLTDDILSFCKQYNIYISTSLDGHQSLHNRNRPKPEKNGYQLTIKGIKKIQSELGVDHVSAVMTTAHRSLDYSKEIVDEYVANDLHSIFLRPLSPYGFALTKGHINRYDNEQWLQFFKDTLDYIISINKQGYPLIEQYSSLVLTKMLAAKDVGYVDLRSPAGIMTGALVYNYNGLLYASDEARMQAEIGHDEFNLGSLHDKNYEELINNDFVLDTIEKSMSISSPQCTSCAFLPYCGSDPVYHLATQNDPVGNKQLSGFCKKNMGIFKHLLTLLEDSDPETQRIIHSWVRY